MAPLRYAQLIPSFPWFAPYTLRPVQSKKGSDQIFPSGNLVTRKKLRYPSLLKVLIASSLSFLNIMLYTLNGRDSSNGCIDELNGSMVIVEKVAEKEDVHFNNNSKQGKLEILLLKMCKGVTSNVG